MKPAKSVLIWFGQLALLAFNYSLICLLMPDVYLYDLYTDKFGFLTEVEWYDRYITALSIFSLSLTTLIIWMVSSYSYKRNKS